MNQRSTAVHAAIAARTGHRGVGDRQGALAHAALDDPSHAALVAVAVTDEALQLGAGDRVEVLAQQPHLGPRHVHDQVGAQDVAQLRRRRPRARPAPSSRPALWRSIAPSMSETKMSYLEAKWW